MRILNSTAEAETLLARALRRLFPPTVTVWNSICMDCKRVYGVQHLPYDERHGREVESHGLCVDCAGVRGVVDDIDAFADGRRDRRSQRKALESPPLAPSSHEITGDTAR